MGNEHGEAQCPTLEPWQCDREPGGSSIAAASRHLAPHHTNQGAEADGGHILKTPMQATR